MEILMHKKSIRGWTVAQSGNLGVLPAKKQKKKKTTTKQKDRAGKQA